MIKRITLIEPKNDHLHIFSKFELPRLGSILLATIMRNKGYQAESLFMKSREIRARHIETDLVGISTITATATSAYAIADGFRKQGIPVVFGGPHVSFLPEEALAARRLLHHGGGREGFPLLVEALNRNAAFADVTGLVWRENGTIRRNPAAPPIEDLDSLPFPDFSLLISAPGARGWGKSARAGSLCPADLARVPVRLHVLLGDRHVRKRFAIGRRERHRRDGAVRPEAEHHLLLRRQLRREPAEDEGAAEGDDPPQAGLKWSTQVRSDVAKDPEMLDLMAEAGCTTLFIGFESVEPGR